jgi:hypothetical protein
VLATSSYDGVVLNWPFLFGQALSPMAGVDLAVTLRLFSAGQLFAPLITHWTNAGAVSRLARRWGLGDAPVFAALLAVASLCGGLVFALVYTVLSGTTLRATHGAGFEALAVTHATFAAAARFAGPALGARARLVVLGSGLACFALAWWGLTRQADSTAWVIAWAQAAALALPAVVLTLAARGREQDR